MLHRTHSAATPRQTRPLQALSKLSVYYGIADHVTFGHDVCIGDGRCWPEVRELADMPVGTAEVELSGRSADTRYFYRVLADNDRGRVWSWETGSFTTNASR